MAPSTGEKSWLLMVHVWPIPEDHEAVTMVKAVEAMAEMTLPDYAVDISHMWAADIEVISLEDLDALPSSTATMP